MAQISRDYPEVEPIALYTHIRMRLAGSTVEDAVEKYLSDHKISSGRFLLLMILEFEEAGMKPSQLSSYMGITQATVTGLIDGLAQTGFVQRREHDRDGRACVVTLTTKGQEFIRAARPRFNRWIGTYYGGLTAEEKFQLVHLLEKFQSSVKPTSLPADS